MKPIKTKQAAAPLGVPARRRTLCMGILFSLFYAVIGARAVYLHIFEGDWLSQKAAGQYKKSLVATGKRGTIYDANHHELAVSIDTTSIAAYPAAIRDSRETAAVLSKIFKSDRRKLQEKLASEKSFVWIKRHASPNESSAVRELNLAGIDFIPEHSRVYPASGLAAQVIGFSGIDGQGLEGIEFYYNDHLKGRTVTQVVMKDALGRGIDARQKAMADFGGNSLILTIDRTIQYIAENAIEEATATYGGKSGMAIVMDVKTGAVLAMAHYPHFNPNTFEKYNRDHWRNRAITDPFEPGSTMKIFVAAAAIDSGFCGANTIFYCEDGAYRIDSNLIHDTHPYGWLSLQQIIKYSSNIGTVKVSEMIGKNTLHRTLCGFGFGRKTGIDCPGETSGSLAPHTSWTNIDTGAISFGQGIAASGIQLISAAAAIANDGILMQPYIVKAILDSNGRLIKRFEPRKVRHTSSPQTARTVRRIMKTVVTEGGTGVNAAVEGYCVCGKTGTAQKIDDTGGYSKEDYVASFIGFAPCETPEVSILVVVDEPREAHYGGTVAAPAFKRIARETLNYLNVPPDGGLQPDWENRLTVSAETGLKG